MAPGFLENLWNFDVTPVYSSWCCSAVIGECVSFLYKVFTQTCKTTSWVKGQTFLVFLCHQKGTQKIVKEIHALLRFEPAHYPKDEHRLRNFKLTVAADISTTEGIMGWHN
jgi:hypothetical protein